MPDFVLLEGINRQRVDFYERMIATDVASLGPNHPSVARDLSGLAALYLSQKKYAEAKPLLERALEIYKTTYGDQALLTRRTDSLLDLVAAEQQPVANASAANDDYLKGLPYLPVQAQKLEIAIRLNSLAFLCYTHGKLEDASKIYRWALADTLLSTGDKNMLVAACLLDYARVLRSQGLPANAETMESGAHGLLRSIMANQATLAIP
jgi:tetratricopeptide (TPR) repeat protein